MGKLLVSRRQGPRNLNLANIGIRALLKFASNYIQQCHFTEQVDLLARARAITDQIDRVQELRLDCSSLPAKFSNDILRADLEGYYKEYLTELLQEQRIEILAIIGQAASHVNGLYAHEDNLSNNLQKLNSSLQENENKLPQLRTEISQLPGFAPNSPLPTKYLKRAYNGLQSLWQLAETHFNNSEVMRESNLETRLDILRQKLSTYASDPIDCEEIIILPPAILAKINAIVGRYYRILLQQHIDALQAAFNRFAEHNIAQYESAVAKLRVINNSLRTIEQVENNQEREYYRILLEQERIKIRKLRIERPNLSRADLIRKLQQQQVEQKIRLNREYADLSGNLGVWKETLQRAIIRDDFAQIRQTITEVLLSLQGLDDFQQEAGKTMLKSLVFWSIGKRKLKGAWTILQVEPTAKLHEVLPYSAGWSLLHEIAQFKPKGDLEQQQLMHFADLLIHELGIPVDLEAKDRGTPLFYAAIAGNDIMVRRLLAERALVNATNVLGFASLHFAAKQGYTEVVQSLSRHPGINLDIQDKSDVDFTDVAQYKFFTVKEFTEVEVTAIKDDAVILTNDNEAYFIIEEQLLKTRSKAIRHMTIAERHGIAPTTSSTLVPVGRDENVDELVGTAMHSIGLSSPRYYDNLATPLHYASYHGHLDVVAILLEAGANPLIKDIHGNTACDWAKAGHQQQIVDLLASFVSPAMRAQVDDHSSEIKPVEISSSEQTSSAVAEETSVANPDTCEPQSVAINNVPTEEEQITEVDLYTYASSPRYQAPGEFDQVLTYCDEHPEQLTTRASTICFYLEFRRKELRWHREHGFPSRTEEYIGQVVWQEAGQLVRASDFAISDGYLAKLTKRTQALHLFNN